jgi:hypothetical protein
MSRQNTKKATGNRRTKSIAAFINTVTGLILFSTPAAAVHGSGRCLPPDSLQPLYDLLHTIGVLAFSGGVALGVIGLSVAGLMIAGPFGEDWVRRGKQVAKNTVLGVIILASANMVVEFLISQLAPSFC